MLSWWGMVWPILARRCQLIVEDVDATMRPPLSLVRTCQEAGPQIGSFTFQTQCWRDCDSFREVSFWDAPMGLLKSSPFCTGCPSTYLVFVWVSKQVVVALATRRERIQSWGWHVAWMPLLLTFFRPMWKNLYMFSICCLEGRLTIHHTNMDGVSQVHPPCFKITSFELTWLACTPLDRRDNRQRTIWRCRCFLEIRYSWFLS